MKDITYRLQAFVRSIFIACSSKKYASYFTTRTLHAFSVLLTVILLGGCEKPEDKKDFRLSSVYIDGKEVNISVSTAVANFKDISTMPVFKLTFTTALSEISAKQLSHYTLVLVSASEEVPLSVILSNSNKTITLTPKTALTPLSTYRFEVKKELASSQSQSLEQGFALTLTIKSLATPPAAPQVNVTTVTTTTADLIWTHSDFGKRPDGTAAAAATPPYTIQVSTDRGSSYQNIASPISSIITGKTASLSGLTLGTTYHFLVRAGNLNAGMQDSLGYDKAAAPSVKTEINLEMAPSAPILVPLSSKNTMEIVLSWIHRDYGRDKKGKSSSGANPDSLTLEIASTTNLDFKKVSEFNSAFKLIFDHAMKKVRIVGVEALTSYRFRLIAKNKEDLETRSSIITVSGNPSLPPDAPESLTAERTLRTVDLKWTTPASFGLKSDGKTRGVAADPAYTIEISTDGGASFMPVPSDDITLINTRAQVRKLRPLTTYSFKLIVMNTNLVNNRVERTISVKTAGVKSMHIEGESSQSVAAPYNTTFRAVVEVEGNASQKVRWSIEDDAGGSTGSKIHATTGVFTSGYTGALTPSSTAPGTAKIKIKATSIDNGKGEMPLEAAVLLTIVATKALPPTEVTNLIASDVVVAASSSLMLNWDAPSFSGTTSMGSVALIKDYRVEVSEKGSGVSVTYTPTGTSQLVTGLKPASIYNIRVRALNNNGDPGQKVGPEVLLVDTVPGVTGIDPIDFAGGADGTLEPGESTVYLKSGTVTEIGGASTTVRWGFVGVGESTLSNGIATHTATGSTLDTATGLFTKGNKGDLSSGGMTAVAIEIYDSTLALSSSGAPLGESVTLQVKPDPSTVKINFITNGGTAVEAIDIPYRGKLNRATGTRPRDPTRTSSDGNTYYFGDWYTTATEHTGKTKYDTSQPVLLDMTLYARWYTKQPADKTALQALISAAPDDANLNHIDVRKVMDMNELFYNNYNFNGTISGWDVSAVTNMESMFSRAAKFNQPLDNWDVSGVTNMYNMFSEAEGFNQPLNSWDVSGVTNMESMFNGAISFSQHLNDWDVSAVERIIGMFYNAEIFDGNIGSWRFNAALKNMSGMFGGAAIFNQDIRGWDVSNVELMDNMFNRATKFSQDLSNWDVSAVTSHTRFSIASNLRNSQLPNFK